MQSRQRLRLAVVLLLVAGLAGGAAFWFYRPGFNTEERKLLGTWNFEKVEGRKPDGIWKPDFDFAADRYLLFGGRTRDEEFAMHWRVEKDRLIITNSHKGKTPLLLHRMHGFAVQLPFARRFLPRRISNETQYLLHWQEDGAVVLEYLGNNSRNAEQLPAIRRIPTKK